MLATSGSLKSVGRVKSPKAKPQTPPAPDPILLARTVEDLAVELVDVIPDHNPRKEFDLVELAKLADTIVFHKGLLQPIIVMAKSDGRYDLLAGERRLRAVRDNLGLKVIYARIVTCDEEARAAITDDENRARVQLNPIEAAESLARRFKASGKSQKAFGETVGLSQAEVSNQMRLLTLPDSIKGLVISGEIVPSDARSMVTFADVPAVVEAVATQIATYSKAGTKVDSGMFRRTLSDAAFPASRPVVGHWFDKANSQHLHIKIDPLTKELREVLDVRMVPDRWSMQNEPRCFNVEAWARHQAEYQAARDAERAAAPKPSDEDDDDNEETDAERDARRLENNLRSYRLKWTQRQIAHWLPTADIVLRTRLLIHFAGSRGADDDCDMEDLEGIFKAHGTQLKPMAGVYAGADIFDYFHALDCDQVEDLSVVLLQRWIQEPPDRYATYGLTAEFIQQLADAFEITLGDFEWKVGLDFLELFNDQQLGELAIGWKLKKFPKEREKLITFILAQNKLPVPECLKSVDICEPKKQSDDENDDDPNFEDDLELDDDE